MTYRFYLDGTLYPNPEGWEELTISVNENTTLRGLLVNVEGEMTFHSSGYDYLKEQYDTNGFCQLVRCDIEMYSALKVWEEVFTGYIVLADVVFLLDKGKAKCKLIDEGLSTYITSNSSIKVALNISKSKSQETIPPALIEPIRFFETDGSFPPELDDRRGVSLFQAFQFLVNYMSDGHMAFVSEFLTAGAGGGYYLFTGKEIRLGGGVGIPVICFDDLFSEVNKKFNIGFAIEIIDGIPTMRIEDQDYFSSSPISHTFQNAINIEQTTDKAQLYAKVKLGASQTEPGDLDPDERLPAIPWITFEQEEYPVIGQCNLDNALDLESQWIIDSNIIFNTLYPATGEEEKHDEDIFIVWTGVGDAIPSLFLTTDVNYYNGTLINSSVALNWLGQIPNSIAGAVGDGNDTFEAFLATAQNFNASTPVVVGKAVYNNEISDPNNRFSAGDYTVPSNGIYDFVFSTEIDFNGGVTDYPADVVISLIITRAGVSPIVITEHHVKNADGVYTINFYRELSLFAGDIVYMYTEVEHIGAGTAKFTVTTDSYFKCTSSQNGGGIYAEFSPEDIKIVDYKFSSFLATYTELKTILADLSKKLAFTYCGTKSGNIKSLKVKLKSGAVEGILRDTL